MPELVGVLLMCRELGSGGSERQLTETARALDRARFAPHVGCFRAEGPRLQDLQAANVPVAEFPVRSFASASVLAGARAMGRYLRRREIQIVHTFDVPSNLFGVPVARWFRKPVVISSQRAFRSLTPGIYHHLLRLTDWMTDAIVVNSAAVGRSLVEQDRVPPGLVHLCPNGVDTSVFSPKDRTGGPLTIGTVAVLRPEKGLPTLLEAAAGLQARLLVVGDGPLRPELEGLASTLGIAGGCCFTGAVRDVAPYLHQMDIFVLPSLSEALSNALVEAMACGCAVVASRVGGNPELVEDGRTGLLFEADNAGDLASKLVRLIDRPEERAALGAAAAERIRSHYSLAAAVRRIEDLYAWLLR